MAAFVATVAAVGVHRTGATGPRADVSATLVPASGVLLGAQVGPGSAGQTLSNLEARVGRRFDIVYQQLRWDEPLERVAALTDADGRIPLLGWTPTRSDGSTVSWRSIARGSEDATVAAMAATLRGRKGKLLLAFASQPGPRSGAGLGSADDYVRAYQHVHDAFASLGVSGVVWVWSVTGAPGVSSRYNQLYPGDAYADWIAVDVGDSRCGRRSAPRSLAGLTDTFHDWVAARHPGKPVMATGYGRTRDAAVAAGPDRLNSDLSAARAQRPEIKALVYAGAGSSDGCGRRPGIATSSTPATPLPSTVTAGRTRGLPTAACLSRDRHPAARVDGTLQTYRVGSVPDDRTYDLRDATIVGYPTVSRYALLFGKQAPGEATCVVGGRVVGQQSRALSWQAMKQRLDGDGLNFRSQGGIVDGIRIDNVEDGISPIGGDPDGVAIWNAYLTYIRDDCVENDAIVALTVRDSLFDGCFNGVSERPGRGGSPPPPSPGESLTLDGVLIRLQPMPYDRSRALCQRNAADGLGSSGFFKWSRDANRLVVRNTVLLAERDSVNCGASMRFPTGAYENVTLVWLGGGAYPGGPIPRGVTVTTDRRVWDEARAVWLTRHGYPVTSAAGTP